MKRFFNLKNSITVFLILVLLLPVSVFAKNDSILETAEGIVAWKKADNGGGENLINDKLLESAGTTAGDWYPIGLSRLGFNDNFEGYLAVIKENVRNRYSEKGKLSNAKATEWHRISLAVLAAGGDPRDMGNDENGGKIDLIADGTYNRGKTASLGRQGINGWIWGLIALDSKRYDVPDDAYNTRDDIIFEIMSKQCPDGGFALMGSVSDPDITAMAVQALAPYNNSETVYSLKTGEKKVYTVINEALDCLSKLQNERGGFESWGTENVESTCQVTVALCALGIDPLSDSRFIKNGNTLLDAIMTFRMPDGGFVHSRTFDSANPASLPDKSNSMASGQVLYTLAALYRLNNGMRTLYDFRSEQPDGLKARIKEIESGTEKLDGNREATLELLKKYCSLPENERSYVNNYRKLSDFALSAGIDISEIDNSTEIVVDKQEEENTVLLYFSDDDKAQADNLPEKLTTEYYVPVVSLLDKLNSSEDFEQKDYYLNKLTKAKGEIEALQAEIDSINAEVKEKLYPFENITLKDKKTVDGIVNRYNNLSKYDREKILRYEDILKTKTKLDNTVRAIWIFAFLAVFGSVLGMVTVKGIRKRKNAAKVAMDELAREYEGED